MNKDNCVIQRNEGCFLALLKRKEIVRMDSKYLIQIAELRGIFGDKDKPKVTKSKAQIRAERKNDERSAKEAFDRQKVEIYNTGNIDKIIDRLLKPTQATIIRITRDEIWRQNFHILTLSYAKMFPPRCARCDYYSQNYYLLSDNFVTIKQYDETISLRFKENLNFTQAITRRRAQKWWIDLLKYIKRLLVFHNISDVKTAFEVELIDKNKFPPLKLIRFPRGYIAPCIKKKPKELRSQYSVSITILDITQPPKKM